MYRFRELSIGWLVIFFTVATAQDKGFNHELPPGVELINPKDLGLSDADLGKFLGNVKVLGGGQVGDTKTQILTVGFDGDENLNLDDFDIPGLTDKKGSNLPEKDKEIANVAFEKFKEFFKDPKKNAKSYDEVTQRSLPPAGTQYSPSPTFPTVNSFSTPNGHPNNQKHEQVQKQNKDNSIKYSQPPKPSAQTLQQHYPVTLTQPIFSTTNRPSQVPQSTFKSPTPTQQRPTYQPQHPQPQYHPNHNPNPNFNPQNNQNPHRFQNQNGNRPTQFPPQNYITPLLAAQQKLNAHVDQQIYQPKNPQLEFGAKLPSTHAPVQKPYSRENNQVNLQNQRLQSHHQNLQNHQQQKQHHQQPKIQSTQFPPEANYQRFNLYNPQQLPKQHREKESSEESVGKIVRNQLLFSSNSQPQTPQPNYSPNQNPQQFKRPTNQNPNQQLSPSSSIPSPSIQRFPQSQDRPVSHVFIQHDKHSSPVQQTSFHPRFQPPTSFDNNFTPSAPRVTTPTPRIEVTPSMPMILLSTNENAITDPERMARLRQQQRHREELRLRELQRQSHSIKNFEQRPEQSQQQPSQQPLTQAPYQQQEYSTINGQNNNNNNNYNNNYNNGPGPQFVPSSPPPRQFHRQIQNSPPPRPNNNYNDNSINNIDIGNNNYQNKFQNNQNSFNFQAQPQQHQLHSLQSQRPPDYYQTQQPQFYANQPQAQSSNNFAQHVPFQQNQGGFPPRFQVRPDPHQFDYSTIRHKRGYRKGILSLLRGLRWRDRD